jgi:hypothetical protein
VVANEIAGDGGRQRRSASTVGANEIGVDGGREVRDVVERRRS